MFQIFENGKAVAKMQTREELFRYFIRRDLNIYICTTDRIMSYTPSVFQKAPASQCLRMMGTIWDEPNLEEDGDTVA